MAKRFTDTEKWKKPFIRSLPTPYKLLWFYILDDCNHAGIWEVDIEVAEIRTGETFSEKSALEIFGERVQKIAPAKWFIPDFISFQYGELNEKNRVHISIIQILNKYKIKGLTSPLQGAMDKDKDKDKDKDMDKDKIIEDVKKEKRVFKKPEFEEILAEIKDPDEAERYFNYYESNGWRVGRNPMKSWTAAAKNWIRNKKNYTNGNANGKHYSQVGKSIEFDRP